MKTCRAAQRECGGTIQIPSRQTQRHTLLVTQRIERERPQRTHTHCLQMNTLKLQVSVITGPSVPSGNSRHLHYQPQVSPAFVPRQLISNWPPYTSFLEHFTPRIVQKCLALPLCCLWHFFLNSYFMFECDSELVFLIACVQTYMTALKRFND